MGRIDRSKATIKAKGFAFVPFRPTAKHEVPLTEAGLGKDVDLIAFERGGERRVTSVYDAAYHHVIQGTLAGKPYLVSY